MKRAVQCSTVLNAFRCVLFRTACRPDAAYSAVMGLQQTNAVAASWILAAGLIGLAGNVTSISGAAMVLGFGLVPPILMVLRWSDRRQPVIERVHRAHS
jgi:hypothetical protein